MNGHSLKFVHVLTLTAIAAIVAAFLLPFFVGFGSTGWPADTGTDQLSTSLAYQRGVRDGEYRQRLADTAAYRLALSKKENPRFISANRLPGGLDFIHNSTAAR